MDGGSSEASEARFAAYVEALGGALGHADRRQPMHDYCLGLLMPIERKSVEPLAAVTAPGQVAAKTSVFASFYWQRSVVGRGDAGQSGRVGAAGDRAQRADCGLDHRRHGLSQEGAALGRGRPAILRSYRQAGQLSSRGDAVAGKT